MQTKVLYYDEEMWYCTVGFYNNVLTNLQRPLIGFALQKNYTYSHNDTY